MQNITLNPPQKILCIKLGAMGDLVMCSAFFDQLGRNFPQAKIFLLTGITYASVMESHPVFEGLILADDKAIYKSGPLARSRETFRLLALLRREKFDAVFVLHKDWRFNLLAKLSGAHVRVGFSRDGQGGLTHPVAPKPGGNEREGYLDLLRALDLPAVYERSFYYLSFSEDEFLQEFLQSHGLRGDENFIGIGPGGGKNVKSFMPTRRWPLENFIALAKRFREELNARAIIFGGPDEKDLARAIQERCADGVDATALSFGEMASVMRLCSGYIGNDSGPLHIADAMGAQTVGLYGPTDPKVQAPLGPRHTVVLKQVDCSPCYDNGSFPDCAHIKCLTSIEVDEVFAKAKLMAGLKDCKPI